MENREIGRTRRRASSAPRAFTLFAVLAAFTITGCGEGEPGEPGQDGRPGQDGARSLVVTEAVAPGEDCEYGGHRVMAGSDLDGDGSLSAEEITSTSFICHGAPGEAGLASLLKLTRIPASEECEAGGVRIEIGLDANRDGVLDDEEIDHSATQTLCDVVPAACSTERELEIAGDYTDTSGAEHWLRATATATTYTIVPAGAPTPENLPSLFTVERVCADMDRLILRAEDGSFSRLDYLADEGALQICVVSADYLEAAINAALPDFNELASGCAGEPFTALSL